MSLVPLQCNYISAIWFWMMNGGSTGTTCHVAITTNADCKFCIRERISRIYTNHDLNQSPGSYIAERSPFRLPPQPLYSWG